MYLRFPDTPCHIECLRREKNDPRRHKTHCIYYIKGKCINSYSICYLTKCKGSAHCEVYKENKIDHKELFEDHKKIDEMERQNIERYKAGLETKKKNLLDTGTILSRKPTSDLHRCIVCNDGLHRIKKSLKKCSYCGLYYVDIQESTLPELKRIIKEDDVLLMNIKN